MKSYFYKVVVGVVISLNVDAASFGVNTSFDEAVEISNNNVFKIQEVADFFEKKYDISEEKSIQWVMATVDQEVGPLGDIFSLLERIEINKKLDIYVDELIDMIQFSKNKASQKKKENCTFENISEAEAKLAEAIDIYQEVKAKSLGNLTQKEEILLLGDYSFVSLGLGSGPVHGVRQNFMTCAKK